MNAVAEFLREHRERLDLERHGLGGGIATLVVTPRFRASRHVVVLILAEGKSEPALVAKLPRLATDISGVAREYAVLCTVHEHGGPDGVPRPVTLEACFGTKILVQTALRGRLLTRALARRDPVAWGEAAAEWLSLLPRDRADDAWTRLIEAPLRGFAADFGEGALVERTLAALEPLGLGEFPLIVEHGDFAQPNILVDDGMLGAIDWEIGEERGLPAADVCFFLLYLSLSRLRATTAARRRQAFDAAFVGPTAWGRPVLARYANAIGLDSALIEPLVLASIARYVARLAQRLAAGGVSSPTDALWIRENRYSLLWRHALERFGTPSGRGGAPALRPRREKARA